MAEQKYTVLVDGAAGVSVRKLSEQLQEHGFVVEQQLDEIRVIVGRCDDSRLAGIRALPGVRAVEAARKVGPA